MPNTCIVLIFYLSLHRIQSCNDYKVEKNMDANNVLDYLYRHDIKPSMQRMAVMSYLMEHRTHPTADEIYNALHTEMPTLSKTTVYNTLKVLTDKGAALQLTIDEKNCCFDADVTPHAHFLCTHCGRVYDMALSNKTLCKDAIIPKNFRVDEAQLYFRGCCPECAKAEKSLDKTCS